LVGIILLGAALRFLELAEYLTRHPFSAYPIADAATYWNWAARIAAGEIIGREPFFSAPFYPYLLGLIRVVGGSLTTVYVIQISLDLATAGLLAWVARHRFGPAVGLVAAGLYVLMIEPASYSMRVLTSTLQLSLVCLAWLALLAAQRRPTLWRGMIAGTTLGLFALSYPPALACIPVLGAWWWWNTGRTVAAAARAGAAVLAALLVIAPASLHNYRACGELIPISAQAGITFAVGNRPESIGVYTAIPGVSAVRDEQNRDAARVVRQVIGRPATWRQVDGYFLRQGLSCWRSDPLAALRLLGMKAYWFLAGRNYGDIYSPTMELAEGFMTRWRLTPLPTAWLIPPALVAVAVWLRRPGLYLPELMFFGLPLLIVLAFYYSPRYRFPAVPMIVVGCAWALCQAARWRLRPKWAVAVAAALLLDIGVGLVSHRIGFDLFEPQSRARLWRLAGDGLSAHGRPAAALPLYRKAAEVKPDDSRVAAGLTFALVKLGRLDEALLQSRQAVEPQDATLHDQLGRALVSRGRLDQAIEQFRLAVRLAPEDPGLHNNLGIALAQIGDREGAREHFEEALRVDPEYVSARMNLGKLLWRQGDRPAAREQFRQALRLDPSEMLDDPGIAVDLAWHLAAEPGLASADRELALLLAERLNAAGGDRNPTVLSTLAAALAANGRFSEAVTAAGQALELAKQVGASDLAQELGRQIDLYRQGKPYIQGP
jgi:Flp pilus assembly protein TadD